MPQLWQPNEKDDVTPMPCEVGEMACVLEGRHGSFAAQVADFFSAHHALNGNAGRSWAWAGVAEAIRERERKRCRER